MVVERHTAGSQASGRAAACSSRSRRTNCAPAWPGAASPGGSPSRDWAGVPLAVARSGSFLIARTVSTCEYLCRGTDAVPRLGRRRPARLPGRAGELAYYQPAGRLRAVVPGGRLHRRAGQPYPGLPGGLPAARGHSGREPSRSSGYRSPLAVRPASRRRAGRSPPRWSWTRPGPGSGRSPSWPAAGTGRPGAPSAADHRTGRRLTRPIRSAGGRCAPSICARPVAGSWSAGSSPIRCRWIRRASGPRSPPTTCRWTSARAAPLAGQVEAQAPQAAAAPVAEHRGGLFTMSPDGRFVAGPVPDAARPVGRQRVQRVGVLVLARRSARRWPRGCRRAVRRREWGLAPARFGPLTDTALIHAGSGSTRTTTIPSPAPSSAGAEDAAVIHAAEPPVQVVLPRPGPGRPRSPPCRDRHRPVRRPYSAAAWPSPRCRRRPSR